MLIQLHMVAVFLWAVFLTTAINELKYKPSKLFLSISFLFMLIVLGVGTKIMLLYPEVTKSGNWLHIKLSFDIIVMLVNVYLLVIGFKNRTLEAKKADLLYWSVVFMFVLMYVLTLFRPF